MKLKDIVDEYLQDLHLLRRSEGTIKKYASTLNRLVEEISKDLDDLTSSDILDWLNITNQDKKPTTQSFTFYVLSSFFKYCQVEELIDKTLIKERWRPLLPKSLPKFLNKSALARVKIKADKLPIRDRAIVELLFSSGCRLSELWGLNIKNVNLKNRSANVLGKGGEYREIHFSIECAHLLAEYLNSRKDNEQALFINKYDARLSRYSIYKILVELGKKAKLPYNLGAHRCRHTMAVELLSKGADLPFIASELGHKNLNTTLIYARVLKDDLICEYNKKMGWI